MSEPLTFLAAYAGHRTDREGATKLTLEIPESELANVLQILRFKEQAVRVTITPEPST
jgi:hypothetical protein